MNVKQISVFLLCERDFTLHTTNLSPMRFPWRSLLRRGFPLLHRWLSPVQRIEDKAPFAQLGEKWAFQPGGEGD